MEILTHNFSDALGDDLDQEALSMHFLYKMVDLPHLTAAFVRSFFQWLWFTSTYTRTLLSW